MSLCVEGLLGLLERQLLQCFAECIPDLPWSALISRAMVLR